MDILRPLMLVPPRQFKTIHIKGKSSPTNCRQRHLRLPVDCPICGRPSLYSYYGARCCECCKQFFRRIIVKQIDSGNCIKGGDCQIQNGIRCNICRLDRCLQAGMDPLQVNVQNSENYGRFLIKLMQRREYNKIKYEEFILDSELKMMDSATGECSFLDSLLFLENKQRRVWNSISELPISYLERFNSIEEFLRYPGNILAKAEQFPENVSTNWNKENYRAKCEQFGIAIPENFACLAIDRFLLVEMAKTLPFFRRLDLKDQISLLRHISMPVGILLNAFYSASMGADTWTRANGLTFISGYLENKRFNGIGRICALSRKKLCTSVAQVKKAELGREEFVLLMVILYSSSTSENLSKIAKELLYSESVRHSRSLLKFLQEKFGPGRGAAKYAECIHLVELIWDIEYIVQMLITYLDTFNLNQAKLMKPSTIPKALMAIL